MPALSSTGMWWVQEEVRRKTVRLESDLRRIDQQLEQVSHNPNERYRQATTARLNRERSYVQLRLDKLKRNRHPF